MRAQPAGTVEYEIKNTGESPAARYKEISGGIAAPQGFRAAGVHCGIKVAKKDLGLIISDVPACGSAVLTQNKVQAAPIRVVKEQLNQSHTFRGIVVNSGNANACTGDRGMRDAWEMVDATAAVLGVSRSEILPASTGVIGEYLPMSALHAGIPLAAKEASVHGGSEAAEAIMTTDTFPKECAVTLVIGGMKVTIGGMAKGSGMIAPNMATMLAFITTDAALDPEPLRVALARATERSFNRITVDGDTSTNDMVAILANGCSGAMPIRSAGGSAFDTFSAALEHLLKRLAKMIARDGEGATKFLEIQVKGATSEHEALAAARSVANSNLVKTAMHGEDPNWGRILAAVGYSGIDFDPEKVEVFFGGVRIVGKRYAIEFSEEDAKEVLRQHDIHITINLNQGNEEATCWTCDLSKEYVAINAHYRT
jgi:glutamate N-acetyltransferase/amino-acid N-acetyltransferase